MTVQRRVSLGLDIGGTNIDVALVDADDGSVSYYGKFSRHTYTGESCSAHLEYSTRS